MTDRTWGAGGLLSDELASIVDERTLAVLARRRANVAHRRGRLVRRALVVADVAGLVLAFALAQVVFAGPTRAEDRISEGAEYLLLLVLVPAWLGLVHLYGLYENDEARGDHATADDLVGVFHLATVVAWLVFAVAWVANLADPYFPKILAFWGLSIGLVTIGRVVARAYCRRQFAYLQNTLIVGAGDVGQRVAKTFLRAPQTGINLVGFVDAEPRASRKEIQHVPLLGPPEQLATLVQALDIERVVVAFSNARDEETLDLIRSLEARDVHVDIVPRLFELLGPSARFFDVQGLPFLSVSPPRPSHAALAIKRIIDLLVASACLVLMLPVIAYLTLRIRLDSPGPAIYWSERIGRNGQRFQLAKFRTMDIAYCRGSDYGGERAETEFWRLLARPDRYQEFAETHKLEDDPRITRFGRRLRSSSVDELPQLANVIRGDISLVGPRAITAQELDSFSLDLERPGLRPYWQIPGVKPGVTGLWQISGRSELSYRERLQLDMVYARAQSLRFDLLILAKTVRVLVSRHGAT